MADNKFDLSKDQRFLRGLIFLAAGTFLLLRFAAVSNNLFFVGAMWFVGVVSLLALGLFLWRIYR